MLWMEGESQKLLETTGVSPDDDLTIIEASGRSLGEGAGQRSGTKTPSHFVEIKQIFWFRS